MTVTRGRVSLKGFSEASCKTGVVSLFVFFLRKTSRVMLICGWAEFIDVLPRKYFVTYIF